MCLNTAHSTGAKESARREEADFAWSSTLTCQQISVISGQLLPSAVHGSDYWPLHSGKRALAWLGPSLRRQTLPGRQHDLSPELGS